MIYNLKTYTATNGNYDALVKRFSEKHYQYLNE